ncbi:MAG: ABC transporter ATP-binding protein [Chitinophagales bacterium]
MSNIKKRLKNLIIQIGALRNIPPFFKIIWETNASYTVLNIALRLIQAVIPIAILFAGKMVVDEVVRLIDIEGAAYNWEALQFLMLWIVIGLALVILTTSLASLVALADTLLGNLVSNEVSERIIRHAATLDLYYFENPDFYDTLERAREQTGNRTLLMSMVLSQLQDMVTLVFLTGAIMTFRPWLLLVMCAGIVPAFFLENYFNQENYSLTHSWTPQRRELDYLRLIGSSHYTAKEIKIFGLENYITNRFANIANRYYEANKKLAIRRTMAGMIFGVLGAVAYYGIYIFVVLETVKGAITLGTMTFLAGVFQRMQSSLQASVGRFSQINDIALYLQDLFDLFTLQPLDIDNKGTKSLPPANQFNFVFENVSFKYPGTNKYALKNLSFELNTGEKIALVGENGAGKTTLVKLLARLYTPSSGRILLNGIDIKEYDYEAYRSKIGVIFQDFVRFIFTARDNIAVGNVKEFDNQELIETAAAKGLADTVIDQLEDKYDQMLGRGFKKGTELSGGQWQKIALARAYMRSDAQVVILDEPTAALDARAEHEVFLRFSELMKGKTGVIISHRFSTVRMADRILFLENGQKLEEGSHTELIEKNGKYAQLFDLQARGYAAS